jgi:hypothetical protein
MSNKWEEAEERDLQLEEGDFKAGQRWDQDPEYRVEPDDFPEPPYVRVGTCLNCGRTMYGHELGDKVWAEDCECHDGP